MTIKKFIANVFLLALLSLVLVLSFQFYFYAWVPRYYLYLAIVPALLGMIQITLMRAESFQDRSVWEVLLIRNYPFVAAAFSVAVLIVPQYLQNIMTKFWFTSWPIVSVLVVSTWIAQRTAHDKLFVQEEKSALQRITGQVKNLKKGQDTLLERIANGVIMLDKRGKVLLCNLEACRVLSTQEDDALGKSFEEVISPHLEDGVKYHEHYEPLKEFKKKILEAKEAFFIHQMDIVTRTEEIVTLNISVTPISEHEHEKPNQFVLIFEDITEKHQLEKMRQDFVNIASHELRTPLTSINGYLSMLLAGQITDAEEEHLYLNRIYDSTKRLSKLVKNILNVSRIDRKQMKVTFKPCDIENIVKEEIENLMPLAGEKNIKMSMTNMLVRHTFVSADEDMLREIIINLLGNAIKYSGNDTQVTVALKRNPDEKILVEVQDQGIGIEEKNISKLFKQFYRIQSTMVEEQQGSGLGLYITKKYIEALKGTINVRSVFSEGSTFYFTLAEAKPESDQQTAQAAGVNLGAKVNEQVPNLTLGGSMSQDSAAAAATVSPQTAIAGERQTQQTATQPVAQPEQPAASTAQTPVIPSPETAVPQAAQPAATSEASEGWKDWQQHGVQHGVQQVAAEQVAQPQAQPQTESNPPTSV